jgi:phosphatidate phosphatase LPIN
VPVLEKEQLAKFEAQRRPLPLPRTATVQNTQDAQDHATQRSQSPPPISTTEAINRAKNLSERLSSSNIPTRVTESGDLMLDMNGYKSSEEDALRAELLARRILSEELAGNYDIGALIGADEQGNLWIYSSEEAKEAAMRKLNPAGGLERTILDDSASDPGYQSDEDRQYQGGEVTSDLQRDPSERAAVGLATPPQTPPDMLSAGDPNRNYAKTLRLTSDQLKGLKLKPGPNTMSFSVNRATCQANMYYWTYNVPVVISDIDGTITKSDALGHVLTMIGRDWTHLGVAKLYQDITANGYNILYLTSRSVGQADTTRAYLAGINQDGNKLPKGPVILSPDRTIAALRREIYLRKPEVFKMACLRDILGLFGQERNPFYAGFGNRFTDALSYRSVNIPPNRIFTINSNAEVSLDLLTLTKYKSSYVSMREIVDHFFPPVGLLVKGGGEDFTDFNYWRETPLELDDFSASESEDEDIDDQHDGRSSYHRSIRSEDEGSEGSEDDQLDEMADSYMSRDSTSDNGDLVDSILESIEDEDLSRKNSIDDTGEDSDEYADDDATPLGEAVPLVVQARGRSSSTR